MNEKIQKLVDTICELTVVEVKELTDTLKDKLGITLEQPQQVIQQVQATEEVKEKSSFDVWLKEVGGQKIAAIKAIRELTGKSLMESKTFVESAPQLIKGSVNKKEADDISAKMAEAGAIIEIK